MLKYLRKSLAELIYPEMETDRIRENLPENWGAYRDGFDKGYMTGYADGVERGTHLERLTWTDPNRK